MVNNVGGVSYYRNLTIMADLTFTNEFSNRLFGYSDLLCFRRGMVFAIFWQDLGFVPQFQEAVQHYCISETRATLPSVLSLSAVDTHARSTHKILPSGMSDMSGSECMTAFSESPTTHFAHSPFFNRTIGTPISSNCSVAHFRISIS